MADVQLDNVTKRYKGAAGHAAVDGVSLHVGDGELVVVVGPSGCGKTTLLRLIAGLETPDSGTIRIGGRDMRGVRPFERRIAMVFQESSLYPHMTVRRNMAFGLEMRKVTRPEIAKRIESASRRMGIAELLDRKPGVLSGGERQRAALASALVRDPSCFLLDEPLGSLDAPLRVQLREDIRQLHLGGRRGEGDRQTMVLVTHDQEEAMSLADRIVVMREGKVQQIGTPREVYQRPANRFVAGFIGSPAMNFIEGRVHGGRFVGPDRVSIPLAGHEGARDGIACVLGVRPEHIRIAAQPSTDSIAAKVDAVQWGGRGDQARADLLLGGSQKLVAQSPHELGLRIGDTVQVALDESNLHLFTADEAGRRLD